MITFIQKLAFGMQEPKPTRGFPPGRVRLRIRTGEFVKARVKTPEGIREYAVKEQDGFWIPAVETPRNVQAPNAERIDGGAEVDSEACPSCEGYGLISYNPNLNPDSFPATTTAKCQHCGGTGSVPNAERGGGNEEK